MLSVCIYLLTSHKFSLKLLPVKHPKFVYYTLNVYTLHISRWKRGKLSDFKPKIKQEWECFSFVLHPLLQNIPDLAPQVGKGILYHHAGLAFPSSIAVLCLPLFLFGWKTLKFLLWIQEILVHLIRDILKFGFSIFFLINWEAGFSKLFHALASGVSGAVLVRVVLWGVTDAISSVPVVVCVVVHPEHLLSLAQVRQCSGPVVGCKMIYCTFHFLRI